MGARHQYTIVKDQSSVGKTQALPFLSLGLVVYIARKVSISLSLLFLLSFIMMYQQFYMVYFISVEERSEGIGECWATLKDYYSCMPLSERLSIHTSQAGTVLIVIATFFLARSAVTKNDF